MKYQKSTESEALLEIGEVPRHTKNRMHAQRQADRVIYSLPK